MIQMTLQLAETAVRAAQQKANALATAMTVTVVDEAGRLVLCARGDGTGFFTPETSKAKAMAADPAHPRRHPDHSGRPGHRRDRLRRWNRTTGPGVLGRGRGRREVAGGPAPRAPVASANMAPPFPKGTLDPTP